MKKLKKFIKKHIVLELFNEWEQLNREKKWNWVTATLIHIYFEKEYEGYQFQIMLFGLGFFFRYNTKKSLKIFKQMQKELFDEFPDLYEK